MNNLQRVMFALVISSVPVHVALAATTIDETRDVNADARISVNNIKGRISVSAWDRNQVHIGGSLGDGVEKLEISGGGSHLDIQVRYPDGNGWFGGGNKSEASILEVRVPKGVVLDLEGVSADIDVNGIDSTSMEVESVSGDIEVGAAAREARVSSVSGDLTLQIDSNELSLESVSGDITARGRITGSLRAETVSGDMQLHAVELREVKLSSVSGDVELRGALSSSGRLRAETVSGDVELYLPASTSVEINADTFSGNIRSPVGKVEKAGFGSGSSLKARMGSGSSRMNLETFSGDIRIELE